MLQPTPQCQQTESPLLRSNGRAANRYGVAVSARYAYVAGVDTSRLAAIDTTSHAVSVFPYNGGDADYVALGYHEPAAFCRASFHGRAGARLRSPPYAPATSGTAIVLPCGTCSATRSPTPNIAPGPVFACSTAPPSSAPQTMLRHR